MKQVEEWRKKLMEDNVKLVYYVVNKYGQYKDDEEYGTAEEAFVRAALNFKPDGGANFTTYATTCMRCRLIQLNTGKRHMISRRHNGHFEYIPCDSLDKTYITLKGGDTITIGDLLEEKEGMNENFIIETLTIKEFFSKLSERDKLILRLKISGATQKEITERVGLSQAYISRIIKKLKKQYKEEV